MLNVSVFVCKNVNQINSLNIMQSYLKKFDIPIYLHYISFFIMKAYYLDRMLFVHIILQQST